MEACVQIADFSQGDRFHIRSATFSKKYLSEGTAAFCLGFALYALLERLH
jgi:hypothetical protein